MLPALSSGYLRSVLICFLLSSSVAIKSRSTTFAGISSKTSTVSSRYISSMNSLISESVSAFKRVSLISEFISVNVSAAISFTRRRNTRIICLSSSSSSISAISKGCIFSKVSFNSLNLLSSSISSNCSLSMHVSPFLMLHTIHSLTRSILFCQTKRPFCLTLVHIHFDLVHFLLYNVSINKFLEEKHENCGSNCRIQPVP